MAIPEHWAINAFGRSNFIKVKALSEQVLVSESVGPIFNFRRELTTEEVRLLEKGIQVLELVAIEAWPDLIHPSSNNIERRRSSEECCSLAFTLARALPIPKQTEDRIFHVLHIIALAYVGQRWSDARRWVFEHSSLVETPSIAAVPWDKRILYRLFECWICLTRKKGWNDLERVAEIVTGLRSDQREGESQFLEQTPDDHKPLVGWTLVGLYHWAAATEMLATYLMQGTPADIDPQIDAHFERATEAALAAGDAEFELLLRWLHLASHQMVQGAFWRIARSVNSRVSRYIEHSARFANMFEMLPPQRAAILEEGLLDPAKRSIVVNLPTSAGKTALAVFRILQALNQFSQDDGWVAYTAPTRALVSQLTRRLREDLGSIGIRVEQLSGAVEIDSFEEGILQEGAHFHVLITTPEKLDLVIRNGRVNRPLALIVVDEAHNIQEQGRGLKLELLLATIKRDCEKASFLLLTPYIPNGPEVAEWLAPGRGAAKSISLAIGPWQPNERVVGLFYTEEGARPRSWNLKFRTLQTTSETIHLNEEFSVGDPGPVDYAFSRVSKNLSLQAAAMAKVFSESQGYLSLAITNDIRNVWSMARSLKKELPLLPRVPEYIRLVQRFLRAEISPQFELIEMLERGIAVHHSGLSDETRALIERLAEENYLRVICATTTIAQGINFPISSLFLASTKYPYGQQMAPREFWNLAGRTGRTYQKSLGVVGIAARRNGDDKYHAIEQFVNEQTEALVSNLVTLVDEVLKTGASLNLESVIHMPQWQAFWGYLAHIYNQTKSPDVMAAQAEQVLRNTFGYRSLEKSSREKARALLEITKEYGRRLSNNSQLATLADATGFSPESLRSAIASLRGKVRSSDWRSEGLFGNNRKAFQNLMGVMLNLPETKKQLQEITQRGINEEQLANITADWVNGKSIEELARKYFIGSDDREADLTDALSRACQSIYGRLSIAATWGISALSKLPTSGLDFDNLSEREKWLINCLPAMIYYGVSTEEAALMRMHGVPRRMAKSLGELFKQEETTINKASSVHAAEFLRGLTVSEWEQAVPRNLEISGRDYREIWQILTGNTEETLSNLRDINFHRQELED